MNSSRKIELVFFLLLAAAAVIVSFLVLQPYLSALFVALVFSVAFRPVHEFFLRVRMREGLAAMTTLLFLFLVVLIPATLFGFFIFDDARNLLAQARVGAPFLERFNSLTAPIEA